MILSTSHQTIRENSNLIILFPQNPKSLVHIHADHCGELSFKEFKDFCNRVWSEKYNFVTLDLTNTERKYRKNFDEFFHPNNSMSFKDDKTVQEYAKLVKKIRARNEDEKTKGMHRQIDLTETFKPVIEATKEQTKELKESLAGPELDPEILDGEYAMEFYFNDFPENRLDVNYGIRLEDNQLIMGNKQIDLRDNKIIVGNNEYTGTRDLWALIMQKNPDLSNINKTALQEYKRLVNDTEAKEYVEQNYQGRYKMLKKTQILKSLGEGITFLPGDINSLAQHLQLSLAEFKAGNRATQNEIVAIVDNLVERKSLSKEEAKEINRFLQNVVD